MNANNMALRIARLRPASPGRRRMLARAWYVNKRRRGYTPMQARLSVYAMRFRAWRRVWIFRLAGVIYLG